MTFLVQNVRNSTFIFECHSFPLFVHFSHSISGLLVIARAFVQTLTIVSFTCCRYSSCVAFKRVTEEVADLAGQHEVIAENLQSNVINKVVILVKDFREERKKVSCLPTESALKWVESRFRRSLCGRKKIRPRVGVCHVTKCEQWRRNQRVTRMETFFFLFLLYITDFKLL